MKQWVIVGLILIAGVAMVWVVIDTLLSGGMDVRERYEIPQGRYDVFVVASSGSYYGSDGFPETQQESGAASYPPALPPTVYEQQKELLGAKFRIGVYKKDLTEARLAVDATFEMLEITARRFDPASRTSEVAQINQEAFGKPVKVSDDLLFILKRAMDASRKTDGAFDVTTGPLRRVWEGFAERRLVPGPDETRSLLQTLGYKYIELDEDAKTIRFTREGVTIDLHDIVRGFMADDASWFLQHEKNVDFGFINVDNNSFFLIGHPSGGKFMMGIPNASGKLKRSFTADRRACVSKGYFRGYQFLEGVAYSGTVDPRTGGAPSSVESVTVVGPDAMTCDAIATAICVLGPSRAINFVEKFNPPK